MTQSGNIGLHPDGAPADSVSSLCVPIVFVPGVMGSRLRILPGRTWDPDDATAMGVWVSQFSGGKQKTRSALRPASTTAATLTDFPDGWVTKKIDSAADIAWPQDDVLGNARCRAIATAVVGTDDEDTLVRYYSEVRNWASAAWGFYGSLLMYLETMLNPSGDDPSFPVYAFGYDWRQSNTTSGLELSRFISSTIARHTLASQVILVTHSMGGLVVRGGLAHDGFMVSRVAGVVHTAQPSNGAAVCYRGFLTGSRPPFDPMAATKDKLLANIIGADPQSHAYNMSGLAGPLQLLPNSLYSQSLGVPWLEGQGLDSQSVSAIYNLYRRPSLPGIMGIAEAAEANCASKAEKASHQVTGDLRDNLTEAEGFHQTVVNTAHDRTYVLFSTGLLTDHSISFEGLGGVREDPAARPRDRYRRDGDDVIDDWSHIRFHRRFDGDGTVDEVSGRCPNLKVLPPTPERAESSLPHAGLFPVLNDQVLHYVRRLLTPSG